MRVGYLWGKGTNRLDNIIKTAHIKELKLSKNTTRPDDEVTYVDEDIY